MNSNAYTRKWIFPLILSLLFSAAYVFFFANRAFVEVDITVSHRTLFNIYWTQSGKGYSEKRHAGVRVTPGKTHYSFFLTDLGRIDTLRIDPHEYRGKSILTKLVISQSGFHPLRFESKEDFVKLKPQFQIDGESVDEGGLTTSSTGNDPQYELVLDHRKGPGFYLPLPVPLIAITCIVFLFFFATEGYREERTFIPVFLCVVCSLVVVMAAISAEDVHPDEYVHLDASKYYEKNWLPPLIDSPTIRHTYSNYGVSRLNSPEVSYFFTGKLARLIDPLKLPKHVALRIFNLFLLGGLLLYLIKNEPARIMAAPLLISSQLWYIFGYCNSDAFALTISFFVSFQAALPDSLLNSYLRGERKNHSFGPTILLAILFSLLFLLKKNYLFYIVFIFGYFCWRILFYIDQAERSQVLKRFCIVVVLGMALAGTRYGLDYVVNGLDKTTKIQAVQEELALPMYKPSTPLAKQHTYLHRKARGDSLKKIIIFDRWFEKTFLSSFGMFGYFTVTASPRYYDIIRWFGIGFFCFFCISIIIRGGPGGNVLLILCLGCSGALIGASLYHSWVDDFQTQGRYLFPLVPMLSILVYHFRHLMQAAIYRLFLSMMFFISIYSFIFVALMRIPKIM